MSAREARLTDPQHRMFLECAPSTPWRTPAAPANAHRLGRLTGPAVNIRTGRSSSLVAVQSAAQSLLLGDCRVRRQLEAEVELPGLTTAVEGWTRDHVGLLREEADRASGTEDTEPAHAALLLLGIQCRHVTSCSVPRLVHQRSQHAESSSAWTIASAASPPPREARAIRSSRIRRCSPITVSRTTAITGTRPAAANRQAAHSGPNRNSRIEVQASPALVAM
ncbi:beta-ketoacyl synthase N-terminal-like domain-containing protein [Streptomyces sp. UG1]|uniref:beta-ketoacyl synthase N-terminal-like domain-containing protein n=1 Tax=Streptomyces sp. UG1 TaxID=3417652 RepID=UPI003CF5BEC5